VTPSADSAAPYRITVVCLGNICRSPIGEAVLRARLDEAGLAEHVVVDSAGTGDWHLGHPADPRALATLDAAGYPHDHVARQIAPHWLDDIDLLLAMDEANYRDLAAMLPSDGASPELRMFRSFDPGLAGVPEPSPELAVPDPYYGGPEGFVEVLHMIEKAADGIVDGLLGRFRAAN
jgi:protein-tyrosine phosphatase